VAIREILRMGDPRLLRVARPVDEFAKPTLCDLVDDLLDTMRANDGAGLAAPQIGVDLQVVVFQVTHNPRYPDAEPVPLTVLINPVLTPLGEEQDPGWEGCLSIPGLRGLVPRHRRLRYQGRDLQGDRIDRTVDGFHARVVQHETDHLFGILYPMRMKDMSQFGFVEQLAGTNLPSSQD